MRVGARPVEIAAKPSGPAPQENAETSQKPWGGGNLDSRCRGVARVRARQSFVIGSQLVAEFFGGPALPGKEGRGEHGNYRHPQNDGTVEHSQIEHDVSPARCGPARSGEIRAGCPTEPVHGEIDWARTGLPAAGGSFLFDAAKVLLSDATERRGRCGFSTLQSDNLPLAWPAAARLGASRPRALAHLRAAPTCTSAARRARTSGSATDGYVRLHDAACYFKACSAAAPLDRRS